MVTLRPEIGSIKIELGIGEPVTREGDLTEDTELKTPDELMRMGLLVLQSQIEGLTQTAKRRKLNGADTRMLNECIRTLHAVQRKESRSEADRKRENAEKSAVESELKRLPRKELLELILPHLEDLGVDVVNLKFISKKDDNEQPKDNPS